MGCASSKAAAQILRTTHDPFGGSRATPVDAPQANGGSYVTASLPPRPHGLQSDL